MPYVDLHAKPFDEATLSETSDISANKNINDSTVITR